MNSEVVLAVGADVAPWLNLAREVEHLFGPMVGHGFDRALLSNMDRESAFCVRDVANVGTLAAGMLFDFRDAPDYELAWLADSERHRRSVLGRRLLGHVLARTNRPSQVRVVTFGPDHPGGRDARRFYESRGFHAGALLENGPDGGSRQAFVLQQRGG